MIAAVFVNNQDARIDAEVDAAEVGIDPEMMTADAIAAHLVERESVIIQRLTQQLPSGTEGHAQFMPGLDQAWSVPVTV